MSFTKPQLEAMSVGDLRKLAHDVYSVSYTVVNYMTKEGLIEMIAERDPFKEQEQVGNVSGDDNGGFFDFDDELAGSGLDTAIVDDPEYDGGGGSGSAEDSGDGSGQGEGDQEGDDDEPQPDGESDQDGDDDPGKEPRKKGRKNGGKPEPDNDAEGEPEPGPTPPPPPKQEDPLAKVIAMAVKQYLETDGIDPEIVMKAIEQKTDGLKEILHEGLGELTQKVDDVVEKKVEKAAKRIKTRPVIVEYTAPDKPNKDLGVQHYMFETVLTDLLALPPDDRNMFLVGPAGSGKNTIVENIATALDLSYDTIPVGLNTSKADLLGFMSATGQYVTTPLRKAYEHGGVFLLDEVDAGNPNVLTCINAIVANSHGGFPDGLVPRHKDFVFFAAGNTFGIGPDAQYVGRLQLDGATRDRFVFREIPYDDQLEEAIAPNKEWLEKVRAIRKAVSRLGEKVIVSPRATIKGGYLINAGHTEEDVCDTVIFRGVSSEIRSRILAQVA